MIDVNGMKFPLDRKYYTKDGAHIWLMSQDDGTVRIGMDAFMAENAGFLTFLTVNDGQIDEGDSIGSFESAKFVSRFYSPVKGEIVELNDEVIANPRKINDDPYGSWIVSIKPEGAQNTDDIIEQEEVIRQWITEEIKKVEEDE